MKVMVMSAPGREDTTARMLRDLERQNPGTSVWVYRSPTRPSVGPFYEMLRATDGDDLLFLEDDIVTARNFVEYVDRWPRQWATSFFHVPHQKRQLGEPVSPVGFTFAQAVKLPRFTIRKLLARRMSTAQFPPYGAGGHDDELGFALASLNEPVIYHRSLVQHVGAQSLCWGPEQTLDNRVANDFPGEEFDCSTLLNESER